MTEILLIDQNTAFRENLAEGLRIAGCRVSEAHNAPESINLLSANSFDIIVADVTAPELSKFGALDSILNAAGSGRFVMLVDNDSIHAVRTACRLGRVYDFIATPNPSVRDVVDVVQRAVQNGAVDAGSSEPMHERYCSFVVENSTNLVSIVSASGSFIYINPTGRAMLGLETSEDCRGFSLADCVTDEYRPIIDEGFHYAVANGHWTGECSIYNKQSRDKISASSAMFELREPGCAKPMAFGFVAHDIRQLRLVEQQNAQSRRLESIGQLAAGIAHEINTPIQYIGDNVQFLQGLSLDLLPVIRLACRLSQTADPTERLQLADEIGEGAKSMDIEYIAAEVPASIEQTIEGIERVSSIVRAMKEFSRADSDEPTDVDLNRCLESTITVARNEWKYVAEMHTKLDSELPTVSGHPSELSQVFLNLIANASQAIGDVVDEANGEKGRVTVSTSSCDGFVEVRISDTGSGIPADIRAKVFDPFFTTKDIGKGTGQGLSICHAIIKKHSGTIEFETETATGTTFIVRLPTSAGDAAVSADEYLPRAA